MSNAFLNQINSKSTRCNERDTSDGEKQKIETLKSKWKHLKRRRVKYVFYRTILNVEYAVKILKSFSIFPMCAFGK